MCAHTYIHIYKAPYRWFRLSFFRHPKGGFWHLSGLEPPLVNSCVSLSLFSFLGGRGKLIRSHKTRHEIRYIGEKTGDGALESTPATSVRIDSPSGSSGDPTFPPLRLPSCTSTVCIWVYVCTRASPTRQHLAPFHHRG